MEDDAPCRYLEWDSKFFGCRLARVAANRLSPVEMGHVLKWCSDQAINGLFFLADPADTGTTRLAEENQFQLVDQRVTLERTLVPATPVWERVGAEHIRPCSVEDLSALRAIARVSHYDSRFYADPHFSRSACDALYETWIENGYQKPDAAVLVAFWQGQPAGYIICRQLDRVTGQLDLMAIAKEVQGKSLGRAMVEESRRAAAEGTRTWWGKSLGRALVEEAFCWLSGRNLTRVVWVTQGCNYKSQRLAKNCGFTTQSVQHWYHRWFY
jgi:dTDP-4-amino-4,6-dideoxy-D-galactose acyltransferase